MANHVYKKIEIVGSSSVSVDDAISTAVARSSKSIRNLRWFEVTNVRGEIENGKVAHFQVTMKLGFTLES
ncbi:MAG: dodecin [Acidocella sp.]|uniref:dodecin n=1 Tax=Acidocella sp. TaxID=50710 RepID=UPI003FBEF08B